MYHRRSTNHLTLLAPSFSGVNHHLVKFGSYTHRGSLSFTILAPCLELAEGLLLVDLLRLCASSGFHRCSFINPHEAQKTATAVALEPPNVYSGVTPSSRNPTVKGPIPILCVYNNMGLVKDYLLEKFFSVSNSSPVKTNRLAGSSISSSAEICLVAEVESINTLAISLNRPLFILPMNSPSAPAKMKPYPPPSLRDSSPSVVKSFPLNGKQTRRSSEGRSRVRQEDRPDLSHTAIAGISHGGRRYPLHSNETKNQKIGLGPFGVITIRLGPLGILEPLAH
ncbi:unnamed protein product [Arabis nemorensis]|uniref:Uncharacterized protein n=1 Tax=Arabis nemorensis TaxID=586526 RepID=A0A565CA48_9BRAS|nr:unnamed protein product [Arabis nemorensis]